MKTALGITAALGAIGFAAYGLINPAAGDTGTDVGLEPDTQTGFGVGVQNGLDISNQVKTGSGRLSPQEIAQLASDAGFQGSDLVTIVAVCFAESGGNPDALNSNGTVAPREGSATDTYSVGLWQINLKAHREYQGDNLFDPATNAAAAYRVFQSQGWRAWGGYTSGNYRVYLERVNAAINA